MRYTRVFLFLYLAVYAVQYVVVQYLESANKVTEPPVIKVFTHHPQFTRVIQAFESNFLQGREKGSQLVCTLNGEVVVDVVGGRDEESVFESQTMIFSAGKVIESLAAAILVDKYELKYTDLVAKYWPEFGERFSKEITIAHVLKHQARLGKIHAPFEHEAEAVGVFADAALLEAWVFNALKVDLNIDAEHTSSYHAVTRGILVDLLIYKVDGRRGHVFVRDEITNKLGIAEEECSVGFQEERTTYGECEALGSMVDVALKTILHPVLWVLFREALGEEAYSYWFLTKPEVLSNIAMATSAETRKYFAVTKSGEIAFHKVANSRVAQRLPMLSTAFVCNARSLAKITTELAAKDGGVLLTSEGLKQALKTQQPIFDHLMQRNNTFTNAGWGADRFADDWIGWAGAGGSYVIISFLFFCTNSFVFSG